MRRWLAIVLLAPLPLLAAPEPAAAPHDDNWCADAVDFAMGAAQNLEIGYPLDLVMNSFDRNPAYYQRLFNTLSVDDMKRLTKTVYTRHSSRFQAALGVTETCVPQ